MYSLLLLSLAMFVSLVSPYKKFIEIESLLLFLLALYRSDCKVWMYLHLYGLPGCRLHV